MPTNDPIAEFVEERAQAVQAMGQDEDLRQKSIDWMLAADRHKYMYNFSWMGRPVIRFPNDLVIQQELMWALKPDLVIETGIAHGGSLVFSASMMAMMGIEGEVVGVDIEIRDHNRQAIEAHPMASRIVMYEGDSVGEEMVERVRAHTAGKKCVMVVLDSMHTHEHAYREIAAYGPMVTVGSYCIMQDTFLEFFPKGHFEGSRPWDVGNNPYTAVQQYIGETDIFEIDRSLTSKSMISETIDGYLKRVK